MWGDGWHNRRSRRSHARIRQNGYGPGRGDVGPLCLTLFCVTSRGSSTVFPVTVEPSSVPFPRVVPPPLSIQGCIDRGRLEVVLSAQLVYFYPPYPLGPFFGDSFQGLYPSPAPCGVGVRQVGPPSGTVGPCRTDPAVPGASRGTPRARSQDR